MIATHQRFRISLLIHHIHTCTYYKHHCDLRKTNLKRWLAFTLLPITATHPTTAATAQYLWLGLVVVPVVGCPVL